MYALKIVVLLKLVMPISTNTKDNKIDTTNEFNEFVNEYDNPNAYRRVVRSNKIDIIKDGNYVGARDEETLVITRVNIMIHEGDQVKLPCITHNSMEIYEDRVLVEIKEKTEKWAISCQYGEDTRVCKAEGNSDAYNMTGEGPDDEIIVEVEVREMGSYECTIIGSKGCTIDDEEYLCWNHKHRIIITVMPINDNPPPGKVIGVGALTKVNKSAIPCGRGFTAYEPAEINDGVTTGLIQTITRIYKEKELSGKELVGECITDSFGRVTCNQDNVTLKNLNGDAGSKMFELEIIGAENEISGTYTCETKMEDMNDEESLCTDMSQDKGIWTMNMWKCRELTQEYEGTIYKGMEDLSIERVPINATGNITVGYDYIVKTSSIGDNVSCVIQIGGEILQEFSEINPEKVTSKGVLRCCAYKKGCNYVHPWSDQENAGFKWVIYPMSRQVGSHQGRNLLRLRAKSHGSTTLYGLCSLDRSTPENYEILIKIVMIIGFVSLATLILVLNIWFSKHRENKYIVEQKRIQVTYRAASPNLDDWESLEPPPPHGC